jgi:hypothetical protein
MKAQKSRYLKVKTGKSFGYLRVYLDPVDQRLRLTSPSHLPTRHRTVTDLAPVGRIATARRQDNALAIQIAFRLPRYDKVKMAESTDDHRKLFFQYYEKYYEAKEHQHQHPQLACLYAVYCRIQLQKLAAVPHQPPKEEAALMQDMFAGVLNKELAAEIYSDLYADSKSFQGKRQEQRSLPGAATGP